MARYFREMIFKERFSAAIASVQSALAGFPKSNALSTFTSQCLDAGVAAPDAHNIVTIAVRTELNNFLATKPAEHELVERVRKYVRLSLESAAASLTTVDGAACAVADASLPLLVFEDAFDATPVASASALWGVLEECRDELAAIVNAHQRYRMPLLRTCTALMRRLSRSQHTVLLGRILIGLAYLFPLTDRSGVNLLGHFNVENTTDFEGAEGEDELIASAAAPATSAAAIAAAAAGATSAAGASSGSKASASSNSIDAQLAAVLPSVGAVPRTGPVVAACKEALADADAGRAASSAAFYRAFWRLQRYMAHPGRATASAEAWALFVCTVRTVLRGFEKEDTGGPGGVAWPPVPVLAPPRPAGAPLASSASAATGAGIGISSIAGGNARIAPGPLLPRAGVSMASAAAASSSGSAAGAAGASVPTIEEGEEGEDTPAAAAATPASSVGGNRGPAAAASGAGRAVAGSGAGAAGAGAAGSRSAAVPASAAAAGRSGSAATASAAASGRLPSSSSSSAAVASAGASVTLAHPIRPLFMPGELSFELPPSISSFAPLPAVVSAAPASASSAAAATATSGVASSSAAATAAVVARAESAGSASASSSALFGVKFLTSPNLLRLELRDAAVRRHVLLQALILLNYLAAQRADYEAYAAAQAALAAAQAGPGSGAGGAAAAAAAAASQGGAGAKGSRGRDDRGKDGAAAATAAAASAAASKPDPAAVAAAQAALAALRKPRETFPPASAGLSVSIDIAFLVNLALHLLRRTTPGPDGLAFARSVATLLKRETVWRRWKAAGAPDFERHLPQLPPAVDLGASAGAGAAGAAAGAGVGAKRRGPPLGAGGRPLKRLRLLPKRSLGWASAGLSSSPWALAADRSRVPLHAASDYAAPMRAALEPDSGIEPEYYPSTHRSYVWRAYRALAGERLRDLGDAATLPFVDLVCRVFAIPKPGSGGAGAAAGVDGTGEATTSTGAAAEAASTAVGLSASAEPTATVQSASAAGHAPADDEASAPAASVSEVSESRPAASPAAVDGGDDGDDDGNHHHDGSVPAASPSESAGLEDGAADDASIAAAAAAAASAPAASDDDNAAAADDHDDHDDQDHHHDGDDDGVPLGSPQMAEDGAANASPASADSAALLAVDQEGDSNGADVPDAPPEGQ